MSDFARLVQDLPSSPALQARLEQVDSIDSAVSAAREAGYSITGEEVSAYMRGLQDDSQRDLSDAQLDAVAGGKGGKNKYSVFFNQDDYTDDKF